MIISCWIDPKCKFKYNSIYYHYVFNNKRLLIKIPSEWVENFFISTEKNIVGFIIENGKMSKTLCLLTKSDLLDIKVHRDVESCL